MEDNKLENQLSNVLTQYESASDPDVPLGYVKVSINPQEVERGVVMQIGNRVIRIPEAGNIKIVATSDFS